MRLPRFLRLTIHRKLRLATAAATAVFVLAGLVQERALEQFKVGGPRYALLKQQTQALDAVTALLGDLNASQALLYSLFNAIDSDQAQKRLAEQQELAAAIDGRFSRALAEHGLGEARALIDDAHLTWGEYAKAVRGQLGASRRAPEPTALAAFLEGAHGRRYHRLVEQLEAVRNSLRLRSSELEAEVERGVARWQLALVALVLAFAILLMVALLAVAGSITKPLSELVATARRVAQGDLSIKLEARGSDELGELFTSLARMVAYLREMPLSLRAASGQLTEAVERLGGVVSEQQASVERQAAALQETQVTAKEIRQTSQVAAQQASALLKGARTPRKWAAPAAPRSRTAWAASRTSRHASPKSPSG